MPPQAEIDVRVAGLRKRYGDVTAVDGVDLEIRRGEFFTMLGPSGSGKTTTLRVIAGFEQPDEGSIELGGKDVSKLPPYARDVNTVFQDYALFPHMTVQDNVEYGLRVKKVRACGAAPARGGGARARTARELRRPQAGAALRRSAPAGRARPRDRQPAAGAAARRAARRARPEAAPGAADRAEADPAGARDHLRLRHARPGGGADDERPPGRVQRGPDRADRRARPRCTSIPRASSSPASSASRTCSSAAAAASRCGPRRSACSATGESPEPGAVVEEGRIANVVYVGAITRYHVALDAGGELIAGEPEPRARLERGVGATGNADPGELAARARIHNRDHVERRRRGMSKQKVGRWAAALLATGVLSVHGRRLRRRRQRGGRRGHDGRRDDRRHARGHACRRSARARVSVDLIIWAGYVEDGTTDPKVDWVTDFEKKTGCQVNSRSATRRTRW